MVEDQKQVQATQPAEPKISVRRTPSFSKTYVTNALVTETDSDFRVELFNEKFKVEGGWVYDSEGMLILTKEAAKKLSLMLDEKIKSYEKEHEEIKINEDRLKFNYLI